MDWYAGGLLVLSLIAWVFTLTQRNKIQRWMMEACDPTFLKYPNLDVGLLFLFGFANLTIALMLVVQIFGQSWNTPEESASLSANQQPRSVVWASLQEGDTELEVVDPTSESALPFDSIPGAASNESSGASEVAATPLEKPQVKETSARPLSPALHAAQTLVLLVLLCGMVLSSKTIYGLTASRWGWGPLVKGRWWPTLRVGLLGFLLVVPPVLMLHSLLNFVIPYDHPTFHFSSQLRSDGDWSGLTWVLLNTCLLVPISEEILFRGVFQGFLEQWFAFSRHWTRWVVGPMKESVADWLGMGAAAQHARSLKAPKRKLNQTEWTPILLAAVLFALAHWGQGAAPISLYVFAIALGWVYQRTGNLGICIVMHAGLNAWTMATMLLTPGASS